MRKYLNWTFLSLALITYPHYLAASLPYLTLLHDLGIQAIVVETFMVLSN